MTTNLIAVSFFAGAVCKVYDDMNDNMLFEKHVLLLKHKDCINEFLKTTHTVLLTYSSAVYITPVLFFSITNIIQLLSGRGGYEAPYEFSGVIAFTLWALYLLCQGQERWVHLPRLACMMMVVLGGQYVFDLCLSGSLEYSHRKLFIRFFGATFNMLLFLMNRYTAFVPEEMMYWTMYFVGYCATSCAFQCLLLHLGSLRSRDEFLEKTNRIQFMFKTPAQP